MKGSGPGQFDLPHTIAVDGERVYVGDRENARIQVFDPNGRFLEQWRNVGHPFGLAVAPDHSIYLGDAIAGRIVRLDPKGNLVGAFELPPSERHFDVHEIALDRDGSIYAAEVLNWRVTKLRRRGP